MNHETAKGKRISVAREIDLLAGVIDCLKVTAKLQLEHPEEDAVTFARTTWRTLALLRERVKLMQWILRGSSSPLAALCTENEIAAADEIPGDVTIPLWSSHHTLQRREQDLKKARARVEREQQECERLALRGGLAAKPRLAIVPPPQSERQMTRFLGRITFWGFIAFLFAKGALVLRQKETVAAVSTLLAALMHACGGPDAVADPAPHVAANIVSTAHATPAPASSSARGICANSGTK